MNSFKQDHSEQVKEELCMKLQSWRKWIKATCEAMNILFLVPGAFAGNPKEHPYRHSIADVPISLAVGAVQTPEFSIASHGGYWIMIQVEKPFPLQNMQCMLGVENGALSLQECDNAPLVQAHWTVWDEGHLVSSGSSTHAAKYTEQYIFKFLGSFMGESGKKYVVKVNFTRDGTALNVANPHLIITKIGSE